MRRAVHSPAFWRCAINRSRSPLRLRCDRSPSRRRAGARGSRHERANGMRPYRPAAGCGRFVVVLSERAAQVRQSIVAGSEEGRAIQRGRSTSTSPQRVAEGAPGSRPCCRASPGAHTSEVQGSSSFTSPRVGASRRLRAADPQRGSDSTDIDTVNTRHQKSPDARTTSSSRPSWRGLGRRPTSRRLLLGRGRCALLHEQLDRLLARDRLGCQVARQGPVGDAVGDVGAEASLLDGDRLLGRRVVAQLPQRRSGRGAAATLGLGVDGQRLVERRREQRLLGGERPRVGALLQVRPVATVLRGDLGARLGVDADHARQRQQQQRVVQRDGRTATST